MVWPFLTSPDRGRPETQPISRYVEDVAAGKVQKIELNRDDNEATVTLKAGGDYLVAYPSDYGDDMVEAAAATTPKTPLNVKGKSFVERFQVALTILGLLTMLLVFMVVTGRKTLSLVGPWASKVTVSPADKPKERFKDVGGAEEVIDIVKELVDAFKHPEKYAAFGVKAATGLLLSGPPGTGKTLLARAIAGEADVPFYAMNGADFMGRYLNDGPRAVREVFAQLRRAGGGILFVDEFDTVGSKRSSEGDSGSKELNNTANALLTEMDGFDTANHAPILVIGATNRPNDLDPGILRRFTLQEEMPTPTPAGRIEILKIHLAKLKAVADDVSPERVARLTSGMSGDDIAKTLNQAGLAAIKEAGENGTPVVTMKHIMDALETKQLGSARRSRRQSERDQRYTAGHEAGHALAAFFSPNITPPARVTIVPRGATGGHTRLDSEDIELLTVAELRARLVYCMGGRAAEQLLEGSFTTGAMSDLEKATDIATMMVAKAGMGPFLAQVPTGSAGHDPRIATVSDAVNDLLKEALQEAERLLGERRQELTRLRDRLLEVESLDLDELKEMFGEPVTV